jgi:hypothetical protein
VPEELFDAPLQISKDSPWKFYGRRQKISVG